jgi:acyl-coenzyme A thioesterase PaaI-like protein
VEFKLNLLAPARGERLVARARVVRPGRTLTVCACDVVAVDGRGEKLVATLLGTMMALRGRADLAGAQGSMAPDAGVPLQTT